MHDFSHFRLVVACFAASRMSVLVNIQCTLEKNVDFVLVGLSVLLMSVLPSFLFLIDLLPTCPFIILFFYPLLKVLSGRF